LREKTAPLVTVKMEGKTASFISRYLSSAFHSPWKAKLREVQSVTPSGSMKRHFDHSKEMVSDLKIDPDETLLLQR